MLLGRKYSLSWRKYETTEYHDSGLRPGSVISCDGVLGALSDCRWVSGAYSKDPLWLVSDCLPDPLKQELDPAAARVGSDIWPALTPSGCFYFFKIYG